MSLLEVKDISFNYGEDDLYKDASLRLFEGEHAVLVGPNGTGKSSLLKMINLDLSPDKGTINWVNNIKVGYLDQYAKIDPSLNVNAYLYDVFNDLFQKEVEMNELYNQVAFESDPIKQERLLNWAYDLGIELENSDFYTLKSQVNNILIGLGLPVEALDWPISSLSGGMRAKVILGKLLLSKSDVLLLDEPTNFLDVNHVIWLSRFINSSNKTFVVISHDEEFLSSICNVVFAVENKKITRYKGNYDYYLEQREIRHEQAVKDFNSQQKFIKTTQEFVAKNIARASTTKRAQSRRKILEKLDTIDKPNEEKKLFFTFPNAGATGDDVLKVKNLLIGYHKKPLLNPLSFDVYRGQCIAIVGKNGIGKSTLVKTLLEKTEKIDGSFKWIKEAKISYFSQDQNFDKNMTPYEILSYYHPELEKKLIFQVLGGYGISFDMASRKIHTLSGGEAAKVRLALMKYEKSNVLILDEPTSHLDVNAKNALKEAIITYHGTVILISHEQDFYSDFCDILIDLEDKS